MPYALLSIFGASPHFEFDFSERRDLELDRLGGFFEPFERAADSDRVLQVDPRSYLRCSPEKIGCKSFDAFLPKSRLKAPPKIGVGGAVKLAKLLEKRPNVLAGAADDDDMPPLAPEGAQFFGCTKHPIAYAERLAGVEDVDQPVSLAMLGLGRADVEAPINLKRIGVDENCAEAVGEPLSGLGFPRRGHAHHGDQPGRFGLYFASLIPNGLSFLTVQSISFLYVKSPMTFSLRYVPVTVTFNPSFNSNVGSFWP